MTTGIPWRPDGWSAHTRIGVIAPHADIGPEAELSAMAPAGVSIHAARVYFGAMRAGGQMDPKIPHDPVLAFVEPPALDDTVELLAAAPLDVITLGFTSSAYKLGVDGERALVDRLSARAREIPIVTTGAAAVLALRELEVSRPAVIHPPWFDEDLDAKGAEYFAAQGFTLAHHAPADLPSGQVHATPDKVFEYVQSTAKDAHPDGILIAGNGFRAVGVIAALEDTLGIPVLTANQVLLWRALNLTGVQEAVEGYGRLFSEIAAPVCGVTSLT
jgi:maleate isomerase